MAPFREQVTIATKFGFWMPEGAQNILSDPPEGLKLTADDLKEIDAEVSKITIQGARLPEEILAMSDL